MLIGVSMIPQTAWAQDYFNYDEHSGSNGSYSYINWTYPNFKRVQGNTAYGTMRKVADEGWDTSKWAVIATGGGYWDALAASGLAGLLDAPVVLTDSKELTEAASKLLVSKKVERAVVVGGEKAVSNAVMNQVRKLGVSVERVGGNTAVGTANKVYDYGNTLLKNGTIESGWGGDAIVATNTAYQDALSMAPYAYAKHAPVFLADGRPGTLTAGTASRLKSGGFSRTLVAGGEQAVSRSVDAQVAGAKRLKGNTSYGTSRAVAEFCLSEGMTAVHAGVATGRSYYDALSGAALCGKNNSILVLADEGHETAVEKVLAKHKEDLSEKWAYIFGGSAAFSSKALKALADWNENTPISQSGEKMEWEHCSGCGNEFYDPTDLEQHSYNIREKWMKACVEGRITFAELECSPYFIDVDGVKYYNCGQWCNVFYWVEGGTKTVRMENGERIGCIYNGDGNIIKYLG